MPLPDLEGLTASMFRICDQYLEDSVIVTVPNSEPVTIKAHVDFGESLIGGEFSASLAQKIRVDLDKSLFASKPDERWRLKFAALPNRIFSPVAVEDGDAGLRWAFGVKELRRG